MKKILIPIFGLLFLILLTPFILAKLSNSNIDKKIIELKKNGVFIKEINSDIGYLNSKRVFEVKFDKNTKNFNNFINQADFIVTLTFKNLPITKANFDIKVKNVNILNKNILKGLEAHIVTKDFKTLNYKIQNYKNLIELDDVYGIYKRGKYDKLVINSKKISILKFLSMQNLTFNVVINNLELGLIDYYWKSKKWKIGYNDIVLKGENSEENVTTHLYPNQKYKFEDIFLSDKIGIKLQSNYIAFANVDWKLIANNFSKDNFQNSEFNVSLLWSDTEYQKALVGGGELKGNILLLSKIPKKLEDIKANISLGFDKDLFERITKDFDPKEINKYFKNNKTHIEIENGEIKANGNRIQ